MANDSSEVMSFLANDDAAVHAMMSGQVTDNQSVTSPASDADNEDTCGSYNWPVLFLFTIVIVAIGMTPSTFVTLYYIALRVFFSSVTVLTLCSAKTKKLSVVHISYCRSFSR